MTFLRLLVTIVCFNLVTGPVVMASGENGLGLSLTGDLGTVGSGSEYVSGNYPGAVLMPINLWGAVGKPGIHHVPTRTDLITLLSLAGGPLPDAKIDTILIKRRASQGEQVIKIDADDFLSKPGVQSPVLEANDIVIIPRDKPVISNNTLTVITFIGTLLGIGLAGYALSKQAKSN